MGTSCGWEGRQVSLILFADEMHSVQVKLLSLDNVGYTRGPYRSFMWSHYTHRLRLPLPFTFYLLYHVNGVTVKGCQRYD